MPGDDNHNDTSTAVRLFRNSSAGEFNINLKINSEMKSALNLKQVQSSKTVTDVAIVLKSLVFYCSLCCARRC